MTHARRPGIWAVCLLALASSAGCEIIAGLPEVTDGRDAGTTTDTDTAGCGTDTCTAECEPVVLFGASEPTGLALLGGALYHSEKDKVVAHDIESPYSELAAFPTTAPGDVAADESGVYWATSGCVEHATLDQKDPPTTQIGTCDGSPDGQLALDGARVYWIKGKRSTGDCGGGGDCCGGPDTGCVVSAAKDGTDIVFHASGVGDPRGLAVHGDMLFWGDVVTETLWTCDRSDCAGTTTAFATTVGALTRIVTDDEHVYWLSQSKGAIRRKALPPSDSAEETVATGTVYGAGLAVDETHVYWTEGETGGVSRTRKTLDTGPELLGGGNAPRVAVSCDAVFWTQRGNETPGYDTQGILRAPR